MVARKQAQRRSGLHPLAYLGVEPVSPPNFIIDNRIPTSTDDKNVNIGDLWLNVGTVTIPAPTAEDIWMLVSLAPQPSQAGNATWVNLAGGATALETLTGDSGGAVSGDANDNINIIANNAGINAGSSVLFVGVPASNTITLNVTDASSNTIIGNSSGNLTLTGSNNTIFGAAAGSALTTGSSNVFVGQNCAEGVTTGLRNISIGKDSGSALTTERDNVLINHAGIAGTNGLAVIKVKDDAGTDRVLFHNYPAGASVNGYNIFVGSDAGNFTLTGISNVGIGGGALLRVTTGTANMCIGNHAAPYITTGLGNSALGNETLSSAAAGAGLTTGNYNVANGYQSGQNYRGAESSNILLNNNGVLAETNTCRIGAATGAGIQELNRTFIHGIRGITTGVADAIAVLVDSAGQLGTVSSSRRYKDTIEPLTRESEKILKLDPVTFCYKSDTTKRKNYGLIAEEVEKVLPNLVVYDKEGLPETVRYHELPVLLLAEIKRLNRRIDELEERIIRDSHYD